MFISAEEGTSQPEYTDQEIQEEIKKCANLMESKNSILNVM